LLVMVGLRPARPTLAATLAEIDAARWAPVVAGSPERRRAVGVVGRNLVRAWSSRGWVTASLRADLDVVGLSLETFLLRKAGFAAVGLVAPVLVTAVWSAVGLTVPVLVPLWVSVCAAVVAFLLPDVSLRQAAATRRRDFRTAVGAFLDLVAMRMASGAGLAEALGEAAAIGDGPAFARLRGALADARTDGLTPAAALGRLGQDLALPDLVDTSLRLRLVDTTGAQAQTSLRAQAASLRDRELTDAQGRANERSQSMLVAQVVLGLGFVVFLGYPAVAKVLAL
jgi:Flp pilus assembly protein TadB